MTALQNPRLISIADYLDGEEVSAVKHEYLGGSVHAMAGGTNRHNRISTNIVSRLYSQLEGHTCEACNSDTKVRIKCDDHMRFYYPDGMVVCDPNPESDQYHDHPVVVVEVLSDSTRRHDEYEKRDAYLTIPSLRTLIFVESNAPLVTVHRRGADGTITVEQFTNLEAIVELPEIEASLPLTAMYQRVNFHAEAD